MSLVARFKNPERAADYLSAYDTTLALWPVPYEAVEVPTRFGVTHINIAGSPSSPPLVLIHGAHASSTQWYANVEPLSRHFRVYAPDVVDQMGRSVPKRNLRTPADCSGWLTDMLDALELKSAAMIGHSEGGWQVLNLALTNPQRVARMVLLCPAPAFTRVRWQVFLRMIPIFVMPTRRMFYGYFRWASTASWDETHPHPFAEQYMIGAQSFRPQELSLTVTSVFTDEELRRIAMPALLLIGDREVVYDPQVVLERARRLIPHIETGLIAGGGHMFPIDQAEATNVRILEFLVPG